MCLHRRQGSVSGCGLQQRVCSHSRQCRLDPLLPLQTEGSCTQQTQPGLTQTFSVWTRDSVIKFKYLLNQAFKSAFFCRTFIFVHTTLQLVHDKGEIYIYLFTYLFVCISPLLWQSFMIQKTQLAISEAIRLSEYHGRNISEN